MSSARERTATPLFVLASLSGGVAASWFEVSAIGTMPR